jgi:dihydrofolate synthase/folylpolyglutamate synthase
LSSIAGEKAGIIKPAVPVVSGVTQWEPAEVIRQRARQNGCRLSELECDFGFDYHGLSAEWEPHAPLPQQLTRIDYWECLNGCRHQRLGLKVGLLGRHQAANAAVALATIRTLESAGWTVEDDMVRRGLLVVRCPARIEMVSRAPMVVSDTAHNVSSVQALLAVLDEVSCGRRRILVFAASRDKQVREMLTCLLPAFQHVLLTQFLENPRSCAPQNLYDVARPLADSMGLAALPLTLHDSPHDAWTQARRLARDEDVICITGSFFLVSEIRGLVAPRPVGPVEVLLPLAGQPPRSDQQRHSL